MKSNETFSPSIEHYIARNSPEETKKILERMGSPKIKNNQDLLKRVHEATNKFGMDAFSKLAEIETPYRSLILSEYEKSKAASGEKKSNCCGGGSSGIDGESTSGCSGCGGKCGGGSSNADGEVVNKPAFNPAPYLLVGAFTVIVVMLLKN